jgi:AcrR family transcriptional regulator
MPPAAPSPRWRRRAEARPEEILEAALAEFTERGFEAARMEDVARRAGLSKAGVYLYFDSKETLLKELIKAKVAPLARQAEAIAAAGASDPLAALRLIASNAAKLTREPMVLATPRLVISIAGRFPEIADFYRVNVAALARAAIVKLIEAAIAKGAIRAVDPHAAAHAFIGPLLLEAIWTHVLGGESALGPPENLVQQHFDILLNGLELRA